MKAGLHRMGGAVVLFVAYLLGFAAIACFIAFEETWNYAKKRKRRPMR